MGRVGSGEVGRRIAGVGEMGRLLVLPLEFTNVTFLNEPLLLLLLLLPLLLLLLLLLGGGLVGTVLLLIVPFGDEVEPAVGVTGPPSPLRYRNDCYILYISR